MGRTTFLAACLLALLTAPLVAQESRVAADMRREGNDIKESCGDGFSPKGIMSCVVTLATDDPVHVAVGSLPPQNGTGFGLAFVEHSTPNEQWRISWNADAVVATSGAWRAGGYAKFVHIPKRKIVVNTGGTTPPGARPIERTTGQAVFNLFAQAISLDDLTVSGGQGTFAERQTMIGGNAVYPLPAGALRTLRPALVGGVTGRFLSIRSGELGLDQQPKFAEFDGGIRISPSLLDGHVQLNYSATAQQYFASGGADAFHRWVLDLRHTIPLYQTVTSTGPVPTNGPDECFAAVGSRCPPISYSRNRTGAITFRLLSSRSDAGDGNTVPFYMQPTLGGSDLNGERMLAAYDDYRFRGPNLLAFQESVEHSLWGPVGVYALIEQGRVTDAPTGSDGFKASYGVGLTLRAGGFPLVNLTFAWGADGHHVIGTIDPSLLGGAPRPSLY